MVQPSPLWFLFWWLLGEGRRCRDSQVFVWVVQGLGQAGAIAAIASLGLFNRGKHNGWNANKRKDAKKKMGGMPKIQPRAFFFWLGGSGIFPQRWDRPTGTRRKPLEGWGSQKTGWGPSQTDVSMIQKGKDGNQQLHIFGRLMKYLALVGGMSTWKPKILSQNLVSHPGAPEASTDPSFSVVARLNPPVSKALRFMMYRWVFP